MKVLTLTDGTNLEVSDLSTFGDIVNVFATRAEAGAYWANFTEESLKEAKLGDEEFTAVPQSMNADIDEKDGNITAHYINYVISPKPKYEDVNPIETVAPAEIPEAEAPTEEAAAPAEESPAEEVTEEQTEEATAEGSDEADSEDTPVEEASAEGETEQKSAE